MGLGTRLCVCYDIIVKLKHACILTPNSQYTNYSHVGGFSPFHDSLNVSHID